MGPFRQAAQSRIVTTAHGINRGAIPDLSRPEGDSDFYFVPAEDPETAAARIVENPASPPVAGHSRDRR